MTSQTIVTNGVNVAALVDTINAIKADRAVADFKFRVKNKWISGGENRSVVDDFFGARQERRHATAFELVNDEPPVLLSNDKGPNPVEYVLHGLAGCLTTALVYHAAARGIEIKGVATRFEGDLDLHGLLGLSDEVRPGFKEIRVSFDIDADMDEKGKSELIAMAKQHSPVFDIVSNGVQVVTMLGTGKAGKMAA